MKVDVLNMDGKKVSSVELPEKIFQAPINVDLMHQAYVRQIANGRLGTHNTKTRSEVRGGGRKPWRQKGTGRARHGSIRSPQWVGGGKVHTPKPRKYTKDMPKKMRRAALRSALSVKAADNQIVLVDEFKLDEPKTRLMIQALNNLTGDASVLILMPEKSSTYDMVQRTINNIPDVKMIMANYLNIRDLLGYDMIIMPVGSVDVIASFLE